MKPIRDTIDQIAAKRLAEMTQGQRAIYDDCLKTAGAYARGEISLELAMDKTGGGFTRAHVSMALGSSDPRRPDWLAFTEAVYQERITAEGMHTKHGFIAFADVGEHTRSRIVHKPGFGRVIEFQCPDRKGGWFWPSEVSKEERYARQTTHATPEDLTRQRTKWYDPAPPPPPPKDDEDEIIFDEDI